MTHGQPYLDSAVALGILDRDYARQAARWLQTMGVADFRTALLEEGILTVEQDMAILAALAAEPGGANAAEKGPVSGTMPAQTDHFTAYAPAVTAAATDPHGTAASGTLIDLGRGASGGLHVDGAGEVRHVATARDAKAGAGGAQPSHTKFTPTQQLGRGGMGVVELNTDAEIGREVAIKTLLHADDPRAVQRFIEEGQVTGRLEHPNIVPVYELDRDARRRPYLVMKCVRGRTLSEVLYGVRSGLLTTLDPPLPTARARQDAVAAEPDSVRKPPQVMQTSGRLRAATKRAQPSTPLERARPARLQPEQWLTRLLEIYLKVCNAIAFAHAHGVIHRDLKPDNIMVGRFGEVLVMDWGLAKFVGRDKQHVPPELTRTETLNVSSDANGPMRTQEGAIAGTPMYMSPEQAEGRIGDLDQRSDIYALGVLLYEILALNTPFNAHNVYTLLAKVARGEFAPPRHTSRAPWAIPRELQAIAIKAMSLHRGSRYQTVTALKDDVEAWQAHLPVAAHRDGMLRSAQKWVRRRPTHAAVGAISILFVAVLSAVAGITVAQIESVNASYARTDAKRAQLAAQTAREEAARKEAEREAERQRHAAMLLEGHVDELLAELGTQREKDYEKALREWLDLWQHERPKHASDDDFIGWLGATRVSYFLQAFDALHAFARDNPVRLTLDALHYFFRALMRHHSGDDDGALADYRTAIELGPLEAAYNNRGNILKQRGQLQAAIADYTAAIELSPGHAKAFYNRGNAYRSQGRYQEAIADYTAAIERDPGYAKALLNRGSTKLRIDDADGAIEDCTSALAIDPTFAAAYAERAHALYLSGSIDPALADYAMAIRCDPLEANVYNNRGRVWEERGDVALALQDYSKAIQLDETLTLAWFNRGNLLRDSGEYERAIGDYTRLIEINPTSTTARTARAIAYASHGDMDSAMADFQAALDIDPDSASIWNSRAATRHDAGDPLGAIEDCSAALERDPEYASAYYNRGNAYRVLDKFELAIADYTKAIEFDPARNGAYNNRGVCRRKLGDNQGAIEDYTKAIELDPSHALAYHNRAIARTTLGQSDGALADFTKAVELRPTLWQAWKALGTAWADRGDKAEAMRCFTAALRHAPTSAHASIIDARIAALGN